MSEKKDGLSPLAYEVLDGNEYPPYVSSSENIAEFTLKSIVIGALIGAVFGAANAYLGLQVGLTVSASIPAAVMAVAIFKILGKGTILETNMVQTIGSAGESLAAGVIFTIPAFFLWEMSPGQAEIVLISILGGMLGVVFMIPLRRFLIVREHGKLPYPEGTACAEVLVAGQGEASKAKMLFAGMGLGGLYQFLMNKEAFALWTKEPEFHMESIFPKFKGGLLAAEITPELLGVGYIIGPRISAIMLAGGLLGWFVMIPLITMFGAHIGTAVYPETATALNQMGPWAIWSKYVRYIGAGGVAFAGIFSLIKALPVIVESFSEGIKGLGGQKEEVQRTQQDLPFTVIIGGSLILSVAIAVYLESTIFQNALLTGLAAAVMIVVFSFFFVTVSSRIVGLLGSSSNPVSGMTIATLILTCLVFILFGLQDMPNVKVAVLTVGAFVCIAAAIAGDSSQDLKTGFLVGATPRYQQMGEFIGVIASGLTMGWVMYLLKDQIASGALPAPQANLMKLVVDGVMGDSLPWTLVISGVFVAMLVELLGVNSLAFAVGLYLPMSLSVPIMIGGTIRWWIDRKKGDGVEERREAGVLYCSGMIAGAALIGLLMAAMIGPRDNTAFVGSLAQFVKQPGVVLHADSPGKFILDGKVVFGKIPQNFSDFEDGQTKEYLLKFESPKGTHELKIVQTKWSKQYVYANEEGMKAKSNHRNSLSYAVLAFGFLALSLLWVVTKKP